MDKKLVYFSISYSIYKNKIMGQIEAWQKKGFECCLFSIENIAGQYVVYYYEGKDIRMNHKNELYATSKKGAAIRFVFNYILKEYNNEGTYIYIRRLGINIVFSNLFFSKSKSKILYEIPTYPIDSGTTIIRKASVAIEKMFFYTMVYPHIKLVPAFIQKETKRLPSKFVPIQNAVLPLAINENRIYSEYYTFLFVGNLQMWHGLEFIISKIIEYRGNKKVKLMIYSSETECYKMLQKKYKEYKNIIFCGKEEVETIYQSLTQRTIGIGGLNYAQRGATFDTSLKNKDYTAMGIPFVYSLRDLSFENYHFSYKIQLNASNNNLIDDIINWYCSIEADDMVEKIQCYAKENLTYDKQIEIVYRRLK